MLNHNDFTALVNHHIDLVYRVALNCVKHPADAEDVTQNVMLRLLRSAPSFQSEEHIKRWLIRVTVNESKRLLTSPWRSRVVPLDQAERPVSSDMEEQRELLAAVLSLPVKYRLPLYLYYYEGYSAAEVASLLRRPVSTIQTQLARGRERLKQALREG